MKLDRLLNMGRGIIPKKIFKATQPTYHLLLSITGNIRYGFPGRKMIIVGVTGTNGKSTTADLILSVLKENGLKSGMLSTVAFEVAGKRTENTTNRTTLGRWQTPKKLKEMLDAGCTHVVIEVASEGLIMNRLWGIPFDIAVFTNLSPEHLNTHKTMENYRNAKGLLFCRIKDSFNKHVPKTVVVNADDKEAKYFLSFPADKKITYGINNGDVWASNMFFEEITRYTLVDDIDKYNVCSELPAKFNIYNQLAAFSVGKALGLDPEKSIKGLEKVSSVRGRMEEVPNKMGIKIIVDYAVTPDAFELLFTELRRTSKGRIIAVFGATGDRDKEKRPLLGEIAAKMTNYLIITDEESYSENPSIIVDAIAEGVERVRKGNYEIILNRKSAISRAIELSNGGDTIVVTGMGHQKYRNVGGDKKIEWDEVQVIKQLLKQKVASKEEAPIGS